MLLQLNDALISRVHTGSDDLKVNVDFPSLVVRVRHVCLLGKLRNTAQLNNALISRLYIMCDNI